MKHTFNVTFIILGLFLLSQFIGLIILTKLHQDETLAFGIQRPELEKGTSFIHVFVIILLVTAIALIIARFNAVRLWKLWFFLSIFIVLTIALSAFFHEYLAALLALLVTFFKIIKPNIIVHNISELFIYG